MPTRDNGYVVREVVRSLLVDVKDFKSDAKAEIAKILTSADQLGNAWDDPQYQEFRGYIEELTSALNSDLEILEEAVIALVREL